MPPVKLYSMCRSLSLTIPLLFLQNLPKKKKNLVQTWQARVFLGCCANPQTHLIDPAA